MTSTQPYVRRVDHEPSANRTAPRRAAFIGGQENQLVGCSLEKLLTQPAPVAGSLLVYYGPTGVGKSLLVEAIVAAWRSRQPQAQILATSAADFARRSAPKPQAANTPAGPREIDEALARCDLFVLEDLDGLAGRGRAETELRLALDDLAARGATVVVTAQAAPQKLERLEPGLASRLAGGLVVPVQLPAAPARQEILRVLAARQGLRLTPAALAKLAEVTSGNALRLNAFLSEFAAAIDTAAQPVELAAIEQYLQARRGERHLDLRLLTRLVAKGFGLTTAELRSSSRKRPIVRARGIAMLLARRYSDHSLERIGKHFGGRDHTTVLHACRKAEEELAAEPAFALLTEKIVAQLASLTAAQPNV